MLSALAVKENTTNSLTVIWIANHVHNIDCVRHGEVSGSNSNPTRHRALLGKPSLDPPLKWEQLQILAKLALLAKKVTLNILLDPKPEKVHFPPESIYENAIQGSSAQSERKRPARNTQMKLNWEYLCQR